MTEDDAREQAASPRGLGVPDEHDPSHRRAVAREFFASALYVALVLLAALVALPREQVPGDASVVGTLFGTALGLITAHLVAFRFAAHFTAERGVADAPIIQEAGAGFAGGLLVAALAALPFLIWDGEDALLATLVALSVLPALMGMAIARLRGRSWLTSVIAAVASFAVAAVVVLLKYELGH